VTLNVKIEPVSGSFEQSAKQLRDMQAKAIPAAANMAASMLRAGYVESIMHGGKFGSRWSDGLHVDVDHQVMRSTITTRHDIPYAGIFETGGTIKGNPFLWIPLSGTDAEGIPAKDYPGGVFSARKQGSGRPLLFAISDKKPRYFGIESVTIPAKWNLRGVQASVMANFREFYDAAFKAA